MGIATAIAVCCSLLLLPVLCLGQSKHLPIGTYVGISFGTTHSCVGVYRRGRIHIIPNDQGNRLTPSLVAFTDTDRLVGEAAVNQAVQNPERTISNVMRLIGLKYDDPDVQRDLKFLPYKVVNKDGKPCIQVKVRGEVKVFSPEEVSAMILTKMKDTAEAYLGKKVNNAVITVPAYFSDVQRQATKDAGVIAGLNFIYIINEPTAAMIAYDLDRKFPYSGLNTLVFDLGGGTFDVTVLTMDHGVPELTAKSGDPHLGGEDFDNRVMDYFINLIKQKHGKDITKDSKALWKLRGECERAKRALSNQHHVLVEIESLIDGMDFFESLTRAKFEELNVDLFEKTLPQVEKALAYANLNKSDIDDIVLVGGSTRIPKVQELLKYMFNGKEPCRGVSPDHAAAYGAAIQGSILGGKDEDETKDVFLFEMAATGPPSPLTQEELDLLVKEAEEYAEKERVIEEINDARNRLKTYIYSLKSQIQDKLGDTIESKDKDIIVGRLKEALKWLEDNHNAVKNEYEEKLREIEAACYPVIKGVNEKSGTSTAEGMKNIHIRNLWHMQPLRIKGLGRGLGEYFGRTFA